MASGRHDLPVHHDAGSPALHPCPPPDRHTPCRSRPPYCSDLPSRVPGFPCPSHPIATAAPLPKTSNTGERSLFQTNINPRSVKMQKRSSILTFHHPPACTSCSRKNTVGACLPSPSCISRRHHRHPSGSYADAPFIG